MGGTEKGATQRYVERINGENMYLGLMSLKQLMELEDHAKSRIMDAQTDLWIVQQYQERLIGGPIDGA